MDIKILNDEINKMDNDLYKIEYRLEDIFDLMVEGKEIFFDSDDCLYLKIYFHSFDNTTEVEVTRIKDGLIYFDTTLISGHRNMMSAVDSNKRYFKINQIIGVRNKIFLLKVISDKLLYME